MSERGGRLQRLRRAVRRRLLHPLRRGDHSPEHLARGVAVGLGVALTPTTGAQIPLVILVWLAVRRLRPTWDFNPVVALAWVWVTNVFTVPPLYYLYVVTGRVLLGRWEELRGYETFTGRLAAALGEDDGWLETLWMLTVNLVDTFGLPILVGSLPWTILGTWLGYRWSAQIARRYRHLAERRRARKRSSQAA